MEYGSGQSGIGEAEKTDRGVRRGNGKDPERDGIVDPDPESANTVISAADRNIVAIEQDLSQQRTHVLRLEGAYEQIRKMKPAEMREVLRTLQIDDQSITKMSEKLQDVNVEMVILATQGVGEDNPKLKELRVRRDAIEELLAKSLASVVSNQEALLKIEMRTLRSLEERFKEALAKQLEDKKKTSAYIDAKTRYLQAKRIFEAGQIKYSTMLLERAR
jgi:hypothetical protein